MADLYSMVVPSSESSLGSPVAVRLVWWMVPLTWLSRRTYWVHTWEKVVCATSYLHTRFEEYGPHFSCQSKVTLDRLA